MKKVLIWQEYEHKSKMLNAHLALLQGLHILGLRVILRLCTITFTMFNALNC